MINKLHIRLRELRREREMTQQDLSKAILVPRVTYTHYELGKRTPDLDTIIQLARYFDVTVDYLLGNSNVRKWPAVLPVQQKHSNDYLIEDNGRTVAVADWPDEEDKYNPFL
ncbi:MAG TPA: transcriptional regulator [Clostridiales bacterium]|nr:transcriptional regulator [Clostridiales bacterium]